jgi:uncharacterized protein (DUF2141 family)
MDKTELLKISCKFVTQFKNQLMKGCPFCSSVLISVAFALIFSCARQAAPTGGLKDITPPKIIKSIPVKGSLNFTGKKVVITFDEFIALEKMTEKFMISPPLKKKPDILVKGKNLEIDFFEKLKDSTTYTMYFQDAVRDLNEGNPIYDFQFAFSTGNVFDSLSVTGNVYFASDLEVPENTQILMHKNLADTAPSKMLPDYIGLADKNGGFRINNIKPGTYNLFALQDKNNNKKYDLADEGFAFLDKNIKITTEKNYLPVRVEKDTVKSKKTVKKPAEIPLIDGEYKLYVFTSPRRSHYLTSSDRKSANQLIYTLSMPPDTIKFSLDIPGEGQNSYFLEKNQTMDTIIVWITDSLLSSKRQINSIVGYPFTDSTGVTNLKTDTIPMSFTPPRVTKATKAKEAQNKFSFSTGIPAQGLILGRPIIFSSETPFKPPDTSRIHLFKSDKTGKTPVSYSLARDTLSTRRYIMTAKLKEGESYLLIADSASFGNIFGGISDSTGIKFQVRTSDTFSKLTVNLTDIKGDILIQLLDTKENLISVKKINKDSKILFPQLDAGKYRLRSVNDLNGDQKWTTGNYKLRLQPEPVSYLQQELDIKINFDSEQDWKLDKWHEKNPKLRVIKDSSK